ncbi:hypothetical protein, partial [Ralstonia sp.]|uniref:hypothetical protein n=1 Tax=Ralstonia sp. TaxID=54061 RepID=UPI0031E2EB88
MTATRVSFFDEGSRQGRDGLENAERSVATCHACVIGVVEGMPPPIFFDPSIPVPMHLHSILSAMFFMALPAHAELLISEYVEGSSNNKAIEIYNPDG